MGSTESSEARRVSFGMDEEERVRVLQGIRLSENVVNRMKDSSQSCQAGQPASSPAHPPSTFGTSKGPEKVSMQTFSWLPSASQAICICFPPPLFWHRYKQEQAKVQDELFQVVTREREAATKHRSVSLQRGEGSADPEKHKSTQLAKELESRESELSRRDTFYKEQLGRIERKVRLLSAALGSQVLKPLTGVHRRCGGERSLHSQFSIRASSRSPCGPALLCLASTTSHPSHKLYSQR
uniref:Coiled-coil-helix-coiled-coil-helix domain containing 6 n=1 Tax=Ursus americanus TaxID=9643 RepID=A0A452SKK9_URSAM